MAYNVFGLPITNSTLEKIPDYVGKTIRRIDRAHVAMNMINAEDEDLNARRYVENLKKQYGDGVSTLCLVYNATGDTVTFATSKDWYGHIGQAPYPVLIANGQWGAFLHVKTAGAATGSSAAVVYRGKNNANIDCDWMLSWSNPWNRPGSDNVVYTEIRRAGPFNNSDWVRVYDLLIKSDIHHSNKWNGCSSTISSGSFTSPILEAILTLENA